MTFNAMTEHYEEITVCGKPALFTGIRIRRDTVPDGLYAYDVRHDDECRGIACEIAPQSSSLASMRSIRFFTCFHSFLNIKAGDGVIPFPCFSFLSL